MSISSKQLKIEPKFIYSFFKILSCPKYNKYSITGKQFGFGCKEQCGNCIPRNICNIRTGFCSEQGCLDQLNSLPYCKTSKLQTRNTNLCTCLLYFHFVSYFNKINLANNLTFQNCKNIITFLYI